MKIAGLEYSAQRRDLILPLFLNMVEKSKYFFIGLFMLSLLTLINPDLKLLRFLLFGTVPVLMLIFWVAALAQSGRAFKPLTVKLSFDETELAEESGAKVAYSDFVRVLPTRGAIAAYLCTGQMLVFPRRAFASDKDYDQVSAWMMGACLAARQEAALARANGEPLEKD